MLHQHHEVRVEAPVEHVWALYRDTSRWHEWLPRGDFTDFTGPVDEVGTTYVVTVRFPGYASRQPMEIVEVEPLRLIHIRGEPGPWEMVWRAEPEGAVARLILESDYDMPGPLPGSIKNLMTKGWMEGNIHRILTDIKAFTEATVPAHA